MADLTETLASSISTAIGTTSASATTQNIWTAHNSTGSAWNASNVFLAGVTNKSCIAFWRDPATPFAAHMTVISAHHAICAAHVGPFVGSTVYAYKEDGTVVSTTIASGGVYQIPGTDICILTFAAPLTGVQVARFLPDTFESYTHKTSGKVYGIFLTQDEKTFVAYTTGSIISQFSLDFHYTQDAADPYYTWFQAGRVGDSSSPFFFIVGGYLVVEESLQGQSQGPSYDDYTTAIQAVMTASTGETLTYVSLSPYATVGDPAIATYVAPVIPAGTVTTAIDNIIGTLTGATYADFSTIGTVTFAILAPYRFYVQDQGSSWGAAALDAANFTDGSTLEILPATANTASVSQLIQSETISGLACLASLTITGARSLGLHTVSVHNLQIGNDSLGTNSQIKCTQIGGFSGTNQLYPTLVTLANISCLSTFESNANQGLIDATLGHNGVFEGDNIAIQDRGTLTSGKVLFRFQASGTGTSYANLSHISSHHSHNVSGAIRVGLVANHVMNLNLANPIFTGTESTHAQFSTITLASGAATLNLTMSGVRGGLITNATSVAAAGVVVNATYSDCLGALVGTTVFADTSLGMTILTNASTLVMATTTPVATDINGANRPQVMPWDSSARVYAGCVNAQVAITLTLTVSGFDVLATWTGLTGADHHTLFYNSTTSNPAVSPTTLAVAAGRSVLTIVNAYNSAGTLLAQGTASRLTATSMSRLPVNLSLSGTETVTSGAGVKSMTLPHVNGGGMFYSLLTNGTGSSQANVLSSLTGTVTAGAPVTVDLAFPDNCFGLNRQLRTVLIKETSTGGTNHLLVGDSTGVLTNACTIFWTQATGQQVVGSGGASVLHNPLGYAIIAPNSKLQLAADTGTVIYQIDLIGVQ